MSADKPRAVWKLEAELGEGAVWVERDSALWFVDIKKQLVHRYDPARDERASWKAPEQVGFVFPAERGGFVAGLQSGLYHFDERTGAFDPIAKVEADKPDNRLNDGAVDPDGRLWFGTMDNKEKDKTGAFYCFADGKVRATGVGGMVVTNGPAVSPDGKTLYLVDTFARRIEQAEIHADGNLGERRPFAKIEQGAGFPDGPTVDSTGALWIGLYGGWAARRYSAGGELIEDVRFPVANVTKLALGGDRMRTAFATTARQLLKPEQIARQPDIGDLFAFAAGVSGVPCPLVRY